MKTENIKKVKDLVKELEGLEKISSMKFGDDKLISVQIFDINRSSKLIKINKKQLLEIINFRLEEIMREIKEL